jgi:hypothetical protein
VDLWKAVAQRADERRVDLLDDPLRRIVGSRIE